MRALSLLPGSRNLEIQPLQTNPIDNNPDFRALPVSEEKLPHGEGVRRSAGAWADDPEGLERFLEWNHQQRKTEGSDL